LEGCFGTLAFHESIKLNQKKIPGKQKSPQPLYLSGIAGIFFLNLCPKVNEDYF